LISFQAIVPPATQAKVPFSEETAQKMLPLLRNDDFIERLGMTWAIVADVQGGPGWKTCSFRPSIVARGKGHLF
jgi:hypothetical protein